MAPRETENNVYAKFWGDKQRAFWYVMVFSGVVNSFCVTQHALHDYKAALQCHQCLLPIRVKLFGEEHQSTADSYNSLGSTRKNCITTKQVFSLTNGH